MSSKPSSNSVSTTYCVPTGRNAAISAVILLGLIPLFFPKNLFPGAPFHDYLLSKVPPVAAWAQANHKAILYGAFGLHTIEAVVLDRTRLSKHGVKVGSPVWFSYVIFAWFFGFTSFDIFDRNLRKQKRAGNSRKN
jgi:hypothetical protein